jgi:hypothetical protein
VRGTFPFMLIDGTGCAERNRPKGAPWLRSEAGYWEFPACSASPFRIVTGCRAMGDILGRARSNAPGA